MSFLRAFVDSSVVVFICFGLLMICNQTFEIDLFFSFYLVLSFPCYFLLRWFFSFDGGIGIALIKVDWVFIKELGRIGFHYC